MGLLDWALDLVGLGLNIWGQHEESGAIQDAAKRNAALYQKEAEYQGYRTTVKLDELEDYRDKLIASQRVAMAKAGIVIDRGTAKQVVDYSYEQYEKDREAILMEGKFNVERAQMGATSSLETASQVKTAEYIGIGRTLLNWSFDRS